MHLVCEQDGMFPCLSIGTRHQRTLKAIFVKKKVKEQLSHFKPQSLFSANQKSKIHQFFKPPHPTCTLVAPYPPTAHPPVYLDIKR